MLQTPGVGLDPATGKFTAAYMKEDAIMQAEEGRGDKMPIVALGEKYSADIFIMLKIENFLKLIGEQDEHGTRTEATFSDT